MLVNENNTTYINSWDGSDESGFTVCDMPDGTDVNGGLSGDNFGCQWCQLSNVGVNILES